MGFGVGFGVGDAVGVGVGDGVAAGDGVSVGLDVATGAAADGARVAATALDGAAATSDGDAAGGLLAMAADGMLSPPLATTNAAEIVNERTSVAREIAMAGVSVASARGRATGTGVMATAPCW